MAPLAWLPCLALLALLPPQLLLTVAFVRRLRSAEPTVSDAPCLPTEVVLCLRGADAGLDQLLALLARQRYRPWRLRLVVDSSADPAWPLVQRRVLALDADPLTTWTEARIETLAARPRCGSLKGAALRQALLSLAADTEVVALIDADASIGEHWLATLVGACQGEGLGAVSGNRWYDPGADSVRGTVRALWATGAIVMMSAFAIPWGGTLAIRREVIDGSPWLELLRTSLCEDTALTRPLVQGGWRHRFVPQLISVETAEGPPLLPLTRWIGRQLVMARLHHPGWPLVAAHGLATSLLLLLVSIQVLLAVGIARWDLLALALATLAGYELASLALAAWISRATARVLALAGRPLRPWSARRWLWQLLLLPLTQLVYGWALLLAITARRVEWRGVIYRLGREGVWIERLSAFPFDPAGSSLTASDLLR